MPQSVWLEGLVTVGVGALSGGITNAVAVWMLFHPYDARGIGPFKLQGAIPKNKARLAKSIGRTVGQRLLTEEDLARPRPPPRPSGASGPRPGRVLHAAPHPGPRENPASTSPKPLHPR